MNTPPVRLKARAAALRDAQDSGIQGSGALPRIIASGRGAVAERIVALAFEHGVPVREDGDLADILAALDEGAEIPPEAIMAVAEVLSHLYRLNRRLAAEHADPHPSVPPDPRRDPC